MGLGIPPLRLKILLQSNPLKPRILVRRLAVAASVRVRAPSVQAWLKPSKGKVVAQTPQA